jgi:hypothetical protein
MNMKEWSDKELVQLLGLNNMRGSLGALKMM